MVDSKENYKLGPGVKGLRVVIQSWPLKISNELKPVFRLFSVVSVVVFILT